MTQKRIKPGDGQVELLWYGERGIINTIALALQKSNVPGVKALLTAVKWAKRRPRWIDSIDDAKLIVEVNCSDFGSPDLVLICTCRNGKHKVIFIEAKTSTYAMKAASLTDLKKQDGFNSQINCQISLKYRLALALKHMNANVLKEPCAIYSAYSQPNDKTLHKDDIDRRRCLAKPEAIRLFEEHSAANLDIGSYYYIVLSTDHDSCFDLLDVIGEEYRPLFLNESNEERWDEMKAQLGWISYDLINNIKELEVSSNKSFIQACSTMSVLHKNQQKQGDCNTMQKKDYQGIKSANVSDIEEDARNIIDSVQRELESQLHSLDSKAIDGGLSVFTSDGKTYAKLLVPLRFKTSTGLMVGTSLRLGRSDWKTLEQYPVFRQWEEYEDDIVNIGSYKKRQPFHVWRIDSREETAVEAIVALFCEIDEMLSS